MRLSNFRNDFASFYSDKDKFTQGSPQFVDIELNEKQAMSRDK